MIGTTAGAGESAAGEGSAAGRRRRGDFAVATACAVAGLLLSTLPHILSWARTGSAGWLNDDDSVLYLAFTARAYHHHPFSLTDPMLAGGGPTIYQRALLNPGIVLARALGLGPMGIDIVWRAWGGISIALGIYLVVRQHVARPGVAAALSLMLVADVGFIGGRPLLNQAAGLAGLVRESLGGPSGVNPKLLANQWRLITPGLSLGFLLLHVWLVGRARARPTWPRLVASGVGLGLLFHIYFYYWTAALPALALAWAIDAGHRRVYLVTGWVGGLIGLPSVLASMGLKSTYGLDWQLRSHLFAPMPRFTMLIVPKVGFVLGAIVLVIAWRRRRDLLYLAALVASGLALATNQVVTGMQIQNWHYDYVWGSGLSILLAVLAADGLGRFGPRPKWATVAIAALVGLDLAGGAWLRAYEVTRRGETLRINRTYRDYRAQRFRPGAPRLAPGAVVAGDLDFGDMATILEDQHPLYHYAVIISPSIKDEEWEARMALNAYLRGFGRPEFADYVETSLRHGEWAPWGPWLYDDDWRDRKRAARLAAFEATLADPTPALDRFRVRYVGLPRSQSPPAYLARGWTQVEGGPYWRVWERQAAR